MLKFTRMDILDMCEKGSRNWNRLYQKGFINYTDYTSDTNEPDSEIVAGWLLEHLDQFESGIQIIRREQSYNQEHDGSDNNPNSRSNEESIAKEMFRQEYLPLLGKLVDYQTPLKGRRTDRAGKIDLLAFDAETKTLRILELKKPSSPETMLRCVLESHTYLKTLDIPKLERDFGLVDVRYVQACPFVAFGRRQHIEMLDKRPNLHRLMEALDSKPFYYHYFKRRKFYMVYD